MLISALFLLPLTLLATAIPSGSGGRAELTGNYCRECHSPGDARLTAPLAYLGGEQGVPTSCRAVGQLRRETYRTGRLMADFDRLGGERDERMEDTLRAFVRATGGEVTSAGDALQQIREAASLLEQSNARLREAISRRKLALAVVWAVVFAFSVGLGIKNRGADVPGGLPSAALALSALLVFVALSAFLFRGETGPEDGVEQAEVHPATGGAGSLTARAWVIGQLGAEWATLDEARGEEVLEEALRMSTGEEVATWRAWFLQEVGRAWIPASPEKAAAILALAHEAALEDRQAGERRDLLLRLIAVAQARLDLQQGLQTVGEVSDPAIRCWGLREIAAEAQSAEVYGLALSATQQISDPTRRARALLETGRLWAATDEDAAGILFAVVQKSAGEMAEGADKAYLLSDLAAAWAAVNPQKGREVAGIIDENWAEARSVATWRVAAAWPGGGPAHDDLFRLAWDMCGGIKDDFSRERVRSDVAAAWGASAPAYLVDMVEEVKLPTLQAETGRRLALAWPDREVALRMAREIEEPYLRVEALTGVGSALVETSPAQAEGLFKEAAALGKGLPAGHTRPLADLAAAWARLDQAAALRLLDRLDGESDRVGALRAIAVLLTAQRWAGAEEVFTYALRRSSALGAESGDLAAARASLELGRAIAPLDRRWAAMAYEQAFELVKR